MVNKVIFTLNSNFNGPARYYFYEGLECSATTVTYSGTTQIVGGTSNVAVSNVNLTENISIKVIDSANCEECFNQTVPNFAECTPFNGTATYVQPITGEEQIIEFDADYIMLKYTFTDGRDLDTRTKMLSPVTSDYLGWARLSRFPATPNPIILDWGGDNTGLGNVDGTTAEAVLINLINYRAAYPSNPVIEIDCRCFWYNTVGVQPVIVEATLWKGGTVIKNTPPYQFSNPTATATAVLDSIGKVITLATTNSTTEGERVGIFSYNNSTNIGQFS